MMASDRPAARPPNDQRQKHPCGSLSNKRSPCSIPTPKPGITSRPSSSWSGGPVTGHHAICNHFVVADEHRRACARRPVHPARSALDKWRRTHVRPAATTSGVPAGTAAGGTEHGAAIWAMSQQRCRESRSGAIMRGQGHIRRSANCGVYQPFCVSRCSPARCHPACCLPAPVGGWRAMHRAQAHGREHQTAESATRAAGNATRRVIWLVANASTTSQR